MTDAARHLRYSISGTGRTARTTSHVVWSATLRTLCGRDASNWFVIDDGAGPPECRLCRRTLTPADLLAMARAREALRDG